MVAHLPEAAGAVGVALGRPGHDARALRAVGHAAAAAERHAGFLAVGNGGVFGIPGAAIEHAFDLLRRPDDEVDVVVAEPHVPKPLRHGAVDDAVVTHAADRQSQDFGYKKSSVVVGGIRDRLVLLDRGDHVLGAPVGIHRELVEITLKGVLHVVGVLSLLQDEIPELRRLLRRPHRLLERADMVQSVRRSEDQRLHNLQVDGQDRAFMRSLEALSGDFIRLLHVLFLVPRLLQFVNDLLGGRLDPIGQVRPLARVVVRGVLRRRGEIEARAPIVLDVAALDGERREIVRRPVINDEGRLFVFADLGRPEPLPEEGRAFHSTTFRFMPFFLM